MAERLAAVMAPGHEPASGFVAETQNNSGQALLNSITQMMAFAQSYLGGLDQTEQAYGAQETSGSQTFQNGMR
ncbi:PE domain-containing protein [Kibdelosporangium sp. 4NS15]|uniref:PE domain-containing protein n=2 Tax=Kibdelosporangium persicum TaxID=2698649 RepID=A0ABX2FF66_9PSEU|nr:PE domain-containing protein [Kibdelosporangium persicum]